MISDKQVCVWYSPRGGGVEEEVTKYLVSSYKIVASFQRDQVDMVPPFCRHNVVVTNGSRVLGLLAPSLPLTAYHHYYVLVLGYLNAKDLANCSAQFGIARATFVSLLETRVFELSSPFSQRSFLISNLSSAIKDESMSYVNLKGRPVTVASFNCSPFVIIHDYKNIDTITGIEWEVLKHIARMLNFTLQLAELNDQDKWGHLVNGSWSGGIARAMQDGDAEIAICNMWYTYDVYQIMDFAPPLNTIRFTFIVPRPKSLLHSHWKGLVQVFDKGVWGLILVLYFAYTLSYWLIAVVDHSQRRAKPEMVKSSLTMFGMLMGTSWPSHRGSSSSRLVVICWCVFVLLLTSTYNTSIASRLTLFRYEQRIDTIQQLVQHDLHWSDNSEYTRVKRSIYFNLANYWEGEWEKRYVSMSPHYMKEALDSGKFAFPIQRWGDSLLFFSVPGLDVRRDLRGMRVVKETTTTFTHESIMFAKRSSFFHASQIALLRVKEAGLVLYWTTLVSRSNINNFAKRLLQEEDDRSDIQTLGMNSLGSAFAILGVGLFASLTIFIVECVFKRGKDV